MVRKLVLARHGRTSWNAAGRFQGQGDPPLDAVGRRQAAELGERLAHRLQGWEVVSVLSSDLRRASQTGGDRGAPMGVGGAG